MPPRPRLNRAPSRRGRRVVIADATQPTAIHHGETAWASAADASRAGNGAEAIARLAEAEAAFLVAGRSDMAARALAQRGVLLAACEQYSDAVTCLEKARAELGDWPAAQIEDRARYLMAYGESLAAIGDHAEAVRHLADAMQIQAELGADLLAAGAALEIAASMTLLGHHADAAAFAEAAQLGFTAAAEPTLIAYSLRMAARAHTAAGARPAAAAAYEAARVHHIDQGNLDHALDAVVAQAHVLRELGHERDDCEPVRLAVTRLTAMAGQLEGLAAARCQFALGSSLTDLAAMDACFDSLDAAIPNLLSALEIFIAHKHAIEAAEAAEHLAVALRMAGRGDEALMHLGRALALAS
ncbi:MAG: hypothetical protein ACOYN3_03810 [Acidimicrobiia bacterium]